ncbi:MAG: asparagine synthase (glutamine-hydrolyzing) [Chloroflexi bacterium]|nr:MAG: asparagine synthase (glutamine-hydrolyzing) [Chloroflexota bacterium]
MCGIVGLLAPDVQKSQLAKANDLLHHRGPDDAGIFLGDGFGMAARRLSIIDLAGGHQPLSNEDGSIWVAFNGEIVNAPELRHTLQEFGHRFRTESDTETIVHAYESWGTEAWQALRGMFAFALWDGRFRQLHLVRDRLGIKPLYYLWDNGRLAFASEIRPLLTLMPTYTPKANLEAIWRLFEIGFIPTPLTAFDGIYKLPAGHTLTWTPRQTEIRPYWQLQFPPEQQKPGKISEPEAIEQFMSHLRNAVQAWKLADVPVGSLLSGGIDSSALAWLLTDLTGSSIHTFHIQFTASQYDESAHAAKVAHALGSHHHTLTFTPADFELLPRVIHHLEEPQCSATSIPIYLLYKACHEAGFKVILTGEGADELLGGYHWFDGDRRIRPFLSLPPMLRHTLAQLPGLPASHAGRRVLAHSTKNPVSRFTLWHQVTPPAWLRRLLSREFAPVYIDWQIRFAPFIYKRDPLNQFLYLEAHTRLPDFINFEVDRMSMAHSVEARPPFLDHLLWEFCAALPATLKLRPRLNKYLLRKGMADILPTDIVTRTKQGLASPHADWWRSEQRPLWVGELLSSKSLHETNYFDAEFVAELEIMHKNGRFDASRILMGILTMQLWHYEFIR